MDIWILVLALLVLAIIILLMSLFAKDPTSNASLSKKVEEQGEKIRELQQDINQLNVDPVHKGKIEEDYMEPVTAEDVYFAPENKQETDAEIHETIPEPVNEELAQARINYDVNDRNREDIIRYYSQGYTLKEIENEVDEELVTIQYVIDEYIENR
ncbi:hypothetical protein [Facklamia miroungae]|uniref:Uncharacterized protein n=1 Tax=Facklamia miroungae TaxID=120956 RepID=A0A1G7V8Q1_9LACT|nr:hypothetical protein [Facklamia miroungae]NKZ30270.1 hypothetical protein [Facklamia miroungae]SDG56166.1 hypothetical protein SAMN05421791_1166 [Facklamia miroungae]